MLVLAPATIALAVLKKHSAFRAVGHHVAMQTKNTHHQKEVPGVQINKLDFDLVAALFDPFETAHASLSDGALTRSEKKKWKKVKKPKLTWEDKFALLRAFKKVHGHCRVPPGYRVGGFQLGGWVATQRKEYIKHRSGGFSAIINDRRVQRLEKVGFEWNVVAPIMAVAPILPCFA